MLSWIQEHRSLIVVSLFLLFTAFEVLWPACRQQLPILGRWFTNICLYLINTAMSVGLHLLPGLFVADWASGNDYGFFNHVHAPAWLVVIAGLLALDLKNYFLHRAMHRFSLLWRLHKVHHSDIDVDITTSFRFHPGEALLTVSLYLLIVLALGLSETTLVIYWFVLNASNFFTHCNMFVPDRLERQMQLGIITASLHRLHHSSNFDDGNRNFGSIFVIWDKLFRTFKFGGGPAQREREFGLPEYRNAGALLLPHLLLMPLDSERSAFEEESLG